jgi:hypothetical protein
VAYSDRAPKEVGSASFFSPQRYKGVESFIIFFVGVGLGFELSFIFAKQVLYYLSHTSSPFFSGYFGDGGIKNYLSRLA